VTTESSSKESAAGDHDHDHDHNHDHNHDHDHDHNHNHNHNHDHDHNHNHNHDHAAPAPQNLNLPSHRVRMVDGAGPSAAGNATAEAPPELLRIDWEGKKSQFRDPRVQAEANALVQSEGNLIWIRINGQDYIAPRGTHWDGPTHSLVATDRGSADAEGLRPLAERCSEGIRRGGTAGQKYSHMCDALAGYFFQNGERVIALAERLAERTSPGQSVHVCRRDPERGAKEIFRQIPGRAMPTANRGTKRDCSGAAKEDGTALSNDLAQHLWKEAILRQRREEVRNKRSRTHNKRGMRAFPSHNIWATASRQVRRQSLSSLFWLANKYLVQESSVSG
jgi:hypothetical protein